MDRQVVERAKEFAREHEASVSELVEGFLERLHTRGQRPSGNTPEIVARLRGLSRPSGGREEYRRHLEKKYGR
ncbi:MAG: DUF6364 family protein [Acidimicrobiia bacterium]